ncbi:MAG: DNA topoisomerase [Methanosarcinaceae archaeon]|nr:DNA topoisomerase [Methanosarcinaceae archaeon]
MESVVIFTDNRAAAGWIAKMLGTYYKYKVGGLNIYEIKIGDMIYKVASVDGHITKLNYTDDPKRQSGTDIAELLSAKPVKTKKYGTIIPMIRAIIPGARSIVVATGNSWDGENIGFEIVDVLKQHGFNMPVQRMRYSSLDMAELKRSFESLEVLDPRLSEAMDVMNILDFQYGIVMTRMFSSMVKKNRKNMGQLSIGSCQTPICGMIYEREKEIEKYESTPYWMVVAKIRTENGTVISAEPMDGVIHDRALANQMCRRGRDEQKAVVQYTNIERIEVAPPEPMSASVLMAECAQNLGLLPGETMRIAEQLYSKRCISYPKTDERAYPIGFDFLTPLNLWENDHHSYGKYVQDILEFGTKRVGDSTKTVTPIHPVGTLKFKETKNEALGSVYDLISRHYISSLMEPMVINRYNTHISIGAEGFLFFSDEIVETGWTEAYPWCCVENGSKVEVNVGDELVLEEIHMKKHTGKIPKPFSNHELFSILDEQGIGIDATLHLHIEKNVERKYIEIEKNRLRTTPLGYSFIECLSQYVPSLLSFQNRMFFTKLAHDVANGNKTIDEALDQGQKIIKMIADAVSINEHEMEARISEIFIDQTFKVIGKCPDCGGSQIVRPYENKEGKEKRIAGCGNYPKCSKAFTLPAKGNIEPVPEYKCKVSNGAVVNVTDGNKKPYLWGIGGGPCFACTLKKECVYRMESEIQNNIQAIPLETC